MIEFYRLFTNNLKNKDYENVNWTYKNQFDFNNKSEGKKQKNEYRF